MMFVQLNSPPASAMLLRNCMNSTLIRERWHRGVEPFVFRLSGGTRVPVAHPDFMAMIPGQIVVIEPKTGNITRIDPLHVVAIEDLARKKSNGKRSR